LTVDDRPDAAAEAAEVEREGLAIAAERQTLFSDAVIAIAITLLALELPAPEGTTNAELFHSALGYRVEYLAFLISFAVIWAHWSAHHRTFRYVTGFDRRLGTLNTAWLFTQVITPFATKVISGDGAFQVRFGFYAVVQAASSILFALMVIHIRRAGLYRPGTPMAAFDDGLSRSWAFVAAFLLSIPLSLLTDYSWVCWIVVPVLGYRIPGLLRRRRS
jgi:uncharacterized membrane protein